MKELDEIINEARKCLNCKVKPCKEKGCPLENDIPLFIEAVKEQNYKKAYEILSETTVLPAICGRICPHEKQCQGSCIKGMKGEPLTIGEIEAFIGDIALKEDYKIPIKYNKKMDKKVAVIGGGPAGLVCSTYLAQRGIDVTIYEKHDYLGGLLAHGIPEFRLPKEVLKKTINQILDLGIKVEYNKYLGTNLTLEKLNENYDAIFIACGANRSTKMNIEGEELQGVYGGNELLEDKNHPDYINKKVAISGGGNVAMDCARTIKRLGASEVKVIYRRAEEQMPAEKKEIEAAKKEGIEFLFQNNIVRILGKEKVEQLELIKTELVQKEGETRKVPVNIENSNYLIDIDYIVMAIGAKTDEIIEKLNLDLNKYGYIQINEENKTSIEKVFAGGDIVGNKATVAWAAKSGRNAGIAIEKYLQSQ